MHKLEALNKAQREAVMHGEGPLLVLAGPGSGKTFTITQRILYLIEKMQVAPEEILVITFTKEAAQSMQRRFQEQSDKAYPVNFGTFHSVFYHILNQSQGSKHNQKRQILQQSQKKQILYSIAINQKFKNSINSEEYISLISAISYYKNTDDMESATNKLQQEWRELFPTIYKEYEKIRKQKNAMDFDDMVYECAELLERDVQLRNYWQNRFHHILMDEFQDINPMQYRVVKLLAKEPYNLFAVGDDDQAIYGFRGSAPECLKQFQEEYGAKQILLNINYRSNEEIVKAASLVIQENKERFAKKLVASSKENPNSKCNSHVNSNQNRTETANGKIGLNGNESRQVSIRAFTEKEEEYHYLTHILSQMEASETCAVLFRTNAYMQGFAARLQHHGIPYVMKEKATSIYEKDVVKDVMAYLRLAMGEDRKELWLRILNKPNRYISREAFAGGLRPILEKELQYLKKAPPFLAVQYVRRVIGYERYLKEKARSLKAGETYLEEAYALLDWLTGDAKQYATITAWLEAQEQYAKPMENEPTSNIHLLTIHASKGLEFEHVWIPDCNEKIYPHGSMPDKKSCEEERRIFYVGMTRAKKSLELLCTTGTKERPRLISRFLNPLWKHYSSSLTTSSNSH